MVLVAFMCDAPRIKSFSKVNNASTYAVACNYAVDLSVPILDRDQNAMDLVFK